MAYNFIIFNRSRVNGSNYGREGTNMALLFSDRVKTFPIRLTIYFDQGFHIKLERLY